MARGTNSISKIHIYISSALSHAQHLQDLIAVFNKYKQNKNVFVSHSYGNIHTMRHLNMLKARGKLNLVAGWILIGLGTNAPTSGGLVIKLPAFVLGRCVRVCW